MTWWEALILGIVQGLTEFFPVSSSGHLAMGSAALGIRLPGIVFEIALHVATLLSVLIVYRQRIAQLFRGLCGRPKGDRDAWSYLAGLALASVPAVLIGLFFKARFEAIFKDPVFAASMLMVTGCVVWSIRWARAETKLSLLQLAPIMAVACITLLVGAAVPFLVVLGILAVLVSCARLTAVQNWHAKPGWMDALLMGLAQAVAILPGITRSGSTVVVGAWRRIDPVAAAEFSFLMSVIAITGAGLLMIPEAVEAGEAIGAAPLLMGSAAAMVSGILAIRFFLALLRRQNFYVFAYYCWAIGSLFLLFAR